MKTQIIKPLILNLFLVSAFLLTCKVEAQTDEYEQAISLIKEQLKDPETTPEIRKVLNDALLQTEEISKEINQDQEQPKIIYAPYEPVINDEKEQAREKTNNLRGIVSPTSTEIPNSSGTTKISSNAN
ncbi:hypothetical protein [Flavobacterium ginsenosidimutans]|uniref:Uncharacterized protein n=1 Tax=Flavobacterium ginsenosidimutans TaxID=687844 RepID=A0ABZ2Q4F3_9FLAO